MYCVSNDLIFSHFIEIFLLYVSHDEEDKINNLKDIRNDSLHMLFFLCLLAQIFFGRL